MPAQAKADWQPFIRSSRPPLISNSWHVGLRTNPPAFSQGGGKPRRNILFRQQKESSDSASAKSVAEIERRFSLSLCRQIWPDRDRVSAEVSQKACGRPGRLACDWIFLGELLKIFLKRFHGGLMPGLRKAIWNVRRAASDEAHDHPDPQSGKSEKSPISGL